MEEESWSSIGVEELLAADSRPSFLADLHRQDFSVVYRNQSIVKLNIHGNASFSPEQACQQWIQTRVLGEQNSFVHQGYRWTLVTLRGRWSLVSGTLIGKDGALAELDRADRKSDAVHESGKTSKDPSLILMKKTKSMCDWTATPPPRHISPWCKFLREWDWGPTAFGPIESWPSPLRLMANIVCSDLNAAVLFWGETLASLYNEAYAELVKHKHPGALGKPYRLNWEELFQLPETVAVLEEIWQESSIGQSTRQRNVTYFLLQGSKLEETIFHLNLLPFLGENGETVGVYQSVVNITDEQVRNRRLSTLTSMAELTAHEEDLGTYFSKVLEGLQGNTYDIPSAMLYSVTHLPRSDLMENRKGPNLMYLEGALGVAVDPDGLPCAHQKLIHDSEFLEMFQRADTVNELIFWDLTRRPELQHLFMDQSSLRGFGDIPEAAILCPLAYRPHKIVSGVLLLTLNTRRPYDEDYQSFIQTLGYTMSSSLASHLIIRDRKRLAQHASERTLEAQQAKSLLAVAPVGCFMMSLEGTMSYVNDAWIEITGYELDEYYEKSWLTVVHEDDHLKIDIEWSKLIDDREPVSFELKLKKRWQDTDPVTSKQISGWTYVLAAASVQQIGSEAFVTGAVTDISRQKWVEGFEKRQRQEAMELKRQQENFIDMTSHEMRNPLSAIFQCSDLIIAGLEKFRRSANSGSAINPSVQDDSGLEDPIETAIDAANTIILCVQHQKRIVDDVLALSKIDAKLIEITPVDVQPKALAENALKIFNAELAANHTQLDFVIEASFTKLQISLVKLDPGRVVQILINLCTNAIKFTADSAVRRITVSLGASLTKPSRSSGGVAYLEGPVSNSDPDPTLLPEWGEGEQLYLQFQVHDTGRGMGTEEMKQLFQRFSQGSPRTHTKYGGSGLGLFIARLLSQLQGGEIGVSSTYVGGTTFAFFVKVRRLVSKGVPFPVAVNPETNIAPTQSKARKQGMPDSLKGPELHPVSILIVEDNLVNQKVLSRQLKTVGFFVSIANNGQEAIDYIRTTNVWNGNDSTAKDLTLVLMDIEMPVMNGTEATKCIRDFQSEGQIVKHVPIIAITANARLEQIEAAKGCGMDEVVSKPFRIPELLEKMEKFLGSVHG